MLPQVVLNALASNEYTQRDGFSATTLIKPPQMVTLQKRYGDDPVENPVDKLWSIFGTAVHNVFEKYAEEDALVEQHYSIEVAGTTIHGTVDHYKDGVISDYKITSSWKYINKDFAEWEQQLNIYSYLMRDKVPVEKLQIIAIFRDWSAMQALRSKDYPQSPIVVIPINHWQPEQQYEYIWERTVLHLAAEEEEDQNLPPCSDKERWYGGTTYAVMKKGGKRAVRVYDNLEEAEAHVGQEKTMHVEIRKGEHRRCQQYCPVASRCTQWRKLQDV